MRPVPTLTSIFLLSLFTACDSDPEATAPEVSAETPAPVEETENAGAPDAPDPWQDFRSMIDLLESDVRARAAETTDPAELKAFAAEWHAEKREAIAATAVQMQELVIAEPERYALPVAQNIRYQLTVPARIETLVSDIRATSEQKEDTLAWNEFEVALLEFTTIALEATEPQ